MRRARAAELALGLAVGLAAAHPTLVGAQTQQDMNQEAWRAYKKADLALNRAYDRLLAKVSPDGKDLLRKAQRTWVQFRDQECEFQTFGSREGTVHPMVVAMCKTDVTTARTKQLQAQLDCPEGDAGCGAQ